MTARLRRLRRRDLPSDATRLARFLIGKILVHNHPQGRLSGRIVETEAYVVGDAAGHAFRGETPRNRSLFLERGHAYVYFIYGCWHAVNVSAERAGTGAGVLLRALQPLEGVAMMQRWRATDRITDLARGPGRLAMALDVDRRYDGIDLCSDERLWLAVDAAAELRRVGRSVRIGISREMHRKLRFFERDNSFVSGPRHLNGRTRRIVSARGRG
jgi:DNA-3-methyladenine glycosylase